MTSSIVYVLVWLVGTTPKFKAIPYCGVISGGFRCGPEIACLELKAKPGAKLYQINQPPFISQLQCERKRNVSINWEVTEVGAKK